MAVYRDGLEAACAHLESVRATIRAQQRQLDAATRAKLPDQLRSELAELEPALSASVESVEQAKDYETQLERLGRKLRQARDYAAQVTAAERAAAPARGKRLRIVAVAIALVVIGALVLLQRQRGAACRASSECASDGRCLPAFPFHGLQRGCAAAEERDCRGSSGCTSEGRCSLVGGRCVAASDVECRGSAQCAAEGLCSASAGRCIAASDADCRASSGPSARDRLVARDGRCVATDETCRRSGPCRSIGACHADGDGQRCVVGSDDDCRFSLTCRVSGQCQRTVSEAGYASCAGPEAPSR